MIAIVNVDPNLRPIGIHRYEIRINHTVIATFEHDRADDLSLCLRKAADAVDAIESRQTRKDDATLREDNALMLFLAQCDEWSL